LRKNRGETRKIRRRFPPVCPANPAGCPTKSWTNRRETGSYNAGERKDLESFFRPKVPQLPGTQRTLALAEQQIDRCLAFKDAKGAEVVAAFRAAK